MNELDIIAPCGLNCKKCINNTNGKIKTTSKELLNLLGNFKSYAERFANFNPVFNDYPQFENVLKFMTQADCEGCRKSGCKFPSCKVIDCIKEKKIYFCYECKEFPCKNSGFNENLEKRWIISNKKIKETGISQYIEETKDLPRYT